VLKLWDLLVLNGYVKVMPALQDALRAAWERFEAGGFPSLQARRLAYFKLLALAGHSSEHWNRYILQELAGEAPAEPEAEAPMDDDGPQALEEIGLEHPGPQPQGPQEGQQLALPLASEFSHLQTRDDLSEAAKLVFDNLPTKMMKGNKYVAYYINGWGGSGKKSKKSNGFNTKAALAAAISAWCTEGDPWQRII
jgi:hypothetical protein